MSEGMKLRHAARAHASADDGRAWGELTITALLYVASAFAALASIGVWWITVPATVMMAAMGLRIYMIQHDCLHNSFFTTRRMNEVVGTLLSPIAMTPFKATRYIHNLHHTHVGDLDRRDAFEIHIMTLDEWNAASPPRRLFYRLYRSPVTLVFIGPVVFFGILRRLPLYGFKNGLGELILHNVLLGLYVFAVWVFAGWPGVVVWAVSVYLGASFGALIPYVVHNFEEIRWGRKPELEFHKAAIEATSVLKWGRLFDLVTMNIAYHDLHHLNAMIPGYRLRAAHADLEARGLLNSVKVNFIDGLRCLQLKLYDEDQNRMIGFPKPTRDQSAIAAE